MNQTMRAPVSLRDIHYLQIVFHVFYRFFSIDFSINFNINIIYKQYVNTFLLHKYLDRLFGPSVVLILIHLFN
jgi:hypothetical protein